MDRSAPVIIGPGAIGCAIGGGLVEAGHRPTFAARTGFDHLAVTHPGGVVESPVDVHTDPAPLGPVDSVILAVKAHQTEGARRWLDRLVDERTTIFVCQNGVEHLERIQPMVPDGATTVPVVINLPANRSEPGRCEVGGRARLTVPAGPGGHTLADLLDGSFVRVKISDDWATAAWTKLLLNAASGGVCTLTRTDNSVFGRDAEVADLAVSVMNEILLVARAEGVDLDDDLPPRIIEGLLAAAPGHVSSIVVDRLAEVPTEWDARNAVVGRLGRRHGIQTPLNDLLTALIRAGEPAPTEG